MTQTAPQPAELTPEAIARVQESFRLVAPIAPVAADIFYDRLFLKAPHLRPLFPADLAGQKAKLVQVLAMAVQALGDLPALAPKLHDLGARHVGYGVTEAHYPIVGSTLLETLEAGLGEDWTPETAAAWTAAFGVLSGAMLEGAAAARAAA